ncbi:MAG TPA: hypothetical protein VHA35_05480 [Dongiaceae bacterium]|jgi:hypothetical protein|nr:hypothetical protein [Dongiaceae bacterium]
MIRIGTFVWLAILTLIGVGLYQVELGVLAKEAELKQIKRQIDANRDAMHVLDAEWSYLNDPTRLADLARRYTDMVPVTPTQMAGFERLMPRQAPVIEGVPTYERNWPVDPLPDANPAGKPPLLLSSAKPNGADDAIGAIIAASQTASPATSPTPALAAATAAQPKKGGQPTDEQAAADDVIDAILADMKKAQSQ